MKKRLKVQYRQIEIRIDRHRNKHIQTNEQTNAKKTQQTKNIQKMFYEEECS
jgi:hypothetical protein